MTGQDSSLRSQITAIILAGGQGKRMGGQDKGLINFEHKPLIQYVIEKILPQVEHIIINANRNISAYGAFGYPVISDTMNNYQGPLAGFLAAMISAPTQYIACVPCDGPMLSDTLVTRLASQLVEKNAEIAVAHDGSRLQPVYALISTSLKDSLEQYLLSGERKIDLWYARHNVTMVDCTDITDSFININTHQERDTLQQKRNNA